MCIWNESCELMKRYLIYGFWGQVSGVAYRVGMTVGPKTQQSVIFCVLP